MGPAAWPAGLVSITAYGGRLMRPLFPAVQSSLLGKIEGKNPIAIKGKCKIAYFSKQYMVTPTGIEPVFQP